MEILTACCLLATVAGASGNPVGPNLSRDDVSRNYYFSFVRNGSVLNLVFKPDIILMNSLKLTFDFKLSLQISATSHIARVHFAENSGHPVQSGLLLMESGSLTFRNSRETAVWDERKNHARGFWHRVEIDLGTLNCKIDSRPPDRVIRKKAAKPTPPLQHGIKKIFVQFGYHESGFDGCVRKIDLTQSTETGRVTPEILRKHLVKVALHRCTDDPDDRMLKDDPHIFQVITDTGHDKDDHVRPFLYSSDSHRTDNDERHDDDRQSKPAKQGRDSYPQEVEVEESEPESNSPGKKDHDPASGKERSFEDSLCKSFDCWNGGQCDLDGDGRPTCECRLGFAGKRCQFSDLPRSCQEVANHFDNKNNNEHLRHLNSSFFRISLLLKSQQSVPVVQCQFDKTSLEPGVANKRVGDVIGRTIIGHNFPPKQLVRDESLTDFTAIIDLKFIDNESVKELVEISEHCSQVLMYECSNAPLRFDRKFTRFRSAVDPKTDFFEIGPTEYATTSGNDSNDNHFCSSKSPASCSCDVPGTMALAFDNGLLSGNKAAVVSATFLQYGNDSSKWPAAKDSPSAYMTLGDLVCQGLKGWNDTVQFKRASLDFPIRWSGQKVTFLFKTDQAESILLQQGSSENENGYLILDVKHGTSLHLVLKFGSSNYYSTHVVASKRPVNDGTWHRVTVELSAGQIRLTLDDKMESYVDVDHAESTNFLESLGYLNFGGQYANFTGCLRFLTVDGKFVNLTNLIRDSRRKNADIVPGCQEFCLEKQNYCLNGGRCIDDYQRGTVYCLCPNPAFVVGVRCENDTSKNTDVSLFSKTHSYVLILNYSSNPLTSDISFNFKTDQPQALLFYAHDHLYNFRQVHLWSASKVTLSTNYGRQVKQCTASSPEKDFDSMDWVQVEIRTTPEGVLLRAGDASCLIASPQDYSMSHITSWNNVPEIADIVEPPQIPTWIHPTGPVSPITLSFFGGVPNKGRLSSRRYKRQTANVGYYTTYNPNLLGSLKNLRIASKPVNLRNYVTDQESSSVLTGSEFHCDQARCKNDGRCSVNWDVIFAPEVSCDCHQTSYSGPECSQDESLVMNGRSFVSYDPASLMPSSVLVSERHYDSFSFAFATPSVKDSSRNSEADSTYKDWVQNKGQILARLQFRFTFDIVIRLIRNRTHSCVRFSINDISDPKRIEFPGNFVDGFRHFVYLRFLPGQLLIRVDHETIETDASRQFSLNNLLNLTLGGGLGRNESNFQGFLSTSTLIQLYVDKTNIDVRPVELLKDQHPTVKYLFELTGESTHPVFWPSQKFKSDDNVDFQMVVDEVAPPEWNKLFVTVPFTEDRSTSTQIFVPDGANGKSSQNIGLIAGIIVCLILIILLSALFALFRKLKRRGRRSAAENKYESEVLFQNEGEVLRLENENLVEIARHSPDRNDENITDKSTKICQPDPGVNVEDQREKTAVQEPTTTITVVRVAKPKPPPKPTFPASPDRSAPNGGGGVKIRASPAAQVVENGRRPSPSDDGTEKKVRIASCSEMFADV